mgnify:CR=1 FL=1
MFDTHCHLNFGAFDSITDEVVAIAVEAGVNQIMIPSTDVTTSEKAIDRASKFENIFSAVGIHPHHVFELKTQNNKIKDDLDRIEELLQNKKVLAVGEVGLDRHYYKSTKYSDYEITNEFMVLQAEVFKLQVQLALKHSKSLILHNREAKKEFLTTLLSVWDKKLEGKTVFHCCEPDDELLEFAIKHKLFIGVDGDVTYSKQKQEFIKRVPLEMLVLETDAPFLSPEPFRSQPRETRGPNMPANLKLIAEFVATLKEISTEQLSQTTTENAQRLFGLNSS